MTETLRCRWVASDQPRVVVGRHEDRCDDDECRGCEPCSTSHCRICGIEHVAGACASCVGAVREDLLEIARLCAELPDEVEVRGVNGEAFNLLGPVADPEARGHLEASVLAGRVSSAYLETADDERHPLFVASSWASVYREAFDHDEPLTRVVLAHELGYLARNLTYAATFEYVPFEDFGKDLRGCVAHLEDVLTEGIRAERSRVTCDNENCGRQPRLERHYAKDAKDDHHVCPACKREYDPGAFRNAHARQLKHKGADRFLPLPEAISTLVAQGRPERTIRAWMSPPKEDADLDSHEVVGAFCERVTHKVWVWWPDLWKRHTETPTRKRNAA